MNIPNEARQAFQDSWSENDEYDHSLDRALTALEAAAPHLLSTGWRVGVRDGERNAALGTSTPNPYEEGPK